MKVDFNRDALITIRDALKANQKLLLCIPTSDDKRLQEVLQKLLLIEEEINKIEAILEDGI